MKRLLILVIAALLGLPLMADAAKTRRAGYTLSPFFGDINNRHMTGFYWATGMGEGDDDTTIFGSSSSSFGDTTISGYSRGWPVIWPHAEPFTMMNVMWWDSILGGDDSIATYLVLQCRTYGFLGVDTSSGATPYMGPDNDIPWYTWKYISSKEISIGLKSFDSLGASFSARRREDLQDVFLPICDEVRFLRINDANHDSSTQTIWFTLK